MADFLLLGPVGLRTARGEVVELGPARQCTVLAALLVAEHPLVEPLTVALMRALQAAGRGPESLACYADLRKRLAERLGTDPGASGDTASESAGSALPPVEAVPAHLPLEAPGFTGRQEELARLDGILADAAQRPEAAIAGPGGIGKTWLALHWAHRHTEQFPDGQLFVNLLGFNPSTPPWSRPRPLRGLLETLGVAPNTVPSTLHGQASLYRSLLADKRKLVVLDNVVTPDQVVLYRSKSHRCRSSGVSVFVDESTDPAPAGVAVERTSYCEYQVTMLWVACVPRSLGGGGCSVAFLLQA